MNATNSSEDDLYGRVSPVECYKLAILGVYCILLLISSLFFNSLLLVTFIRFKELQTPLNLLIATLAALNLLANVGELPFVITSNFSCRWRFGKIGCEITGFIMYFVGCSSIYLMMAISFERFFIIYKPLEIKSMTHQAMIIVIILCLVGGLFWAVIPFSGWSYYTLETALTSCTVEWASRAVTVLTYNVAIFIFVFLIPLAVILGSNLKLVLIVRSMSSLIKSNSQDPQAKRRIKKERELTFVMMLFVFGFVLSWLPYGLVSLYAAFVSADFSPLITAVPAMFAKFSTLWTSMFFVLTNNQFKYKAFGCFGLREEQAEASVTNKKPKKAAGNAGGAGNNKAPKVERADSVTEGNLASSEI